MKRLTILVCTASAAAMAMPANAQAQAAQGSDSAAAGAAPVATGQDETGPRADSRPAAAAAEGDAGIVVTGSRLRDESVQDTPIAVSVLGADAIEDLNAADIQALSTNAPSLVVSNNPTGNQVPFVSLRGFSVVATDISIEPGISIYVDGIYQPTIVGSLSDLFDVERVEVLRGPQSTLLGKNSSAGAILVRRTRPTNRFEARARLEYGTDNLLQAQGLVNVPMIDGVLAGRFYAMARHTDNYGRNSVDGVANLGGADIQAIRGSLRFTPSDNVEWYLSADYTHRKLSTAAGRNAAPADFVPCTVFGFCENQPKGSFDLAMDFADGATHNDFTATSDLAVDLGGARLTSLTGYRDLRMLNNSDVDGTPFPVLHAIDQRTTVEAFSEELRLSSIEGDGLDLGGRLAWLVAAYYNWSKALLYEPRVLNGGPINVAAQESIRQSYAIFSHLDFDVTDALTVSLGARQSWDEVRHNFSFRVPGLELPDPLPYTQSRSDQNFSIEAGAQYKIDPTKMVYFRYSEGYRGGGFIGFPTSLEQAEGGYGPETSRAFEVGLRSEFFDRRLLFNLTLYTAKYNDLQRSETKPSPTGFIILTDNIASARTRGFELETNIRPAYGVNLRGTVAYLDAEYLDYVSGGVDLSQTRFSYAPTWTVAFTPSYEVPIHAGGLFDTLRIQGAWEYRSTYLAAAQDIPENTQPGFSTLDAQVSLMGGADTRYELTAYVQNLTNERYLTYGVYVPPLLFQQFDDRGRRFGVALDIRF